MGEGVRKFWGWGVEGEGPGPEQARGIGKILSTRFGVDLDLASPPRIEDVTLPRPRIAPPPALATLCSETTFDRASHTYGKSYRDIVRGHARRFEHPPDFVARPRGEADVVRLLDWAGSAGVAVVPYGGGSSVVGGVACESGGGYAGVVSLDLGAMGRVLEIDRVSRAARIEAGVLGPALEAQIRPHGMTLRHYPQSFEFSTLGGWIATRSGGHYATLYTHIDEFVEGLRIVTPTGVVETRRLPGSGAGPSPDRLFIGSEGILGVITEAWMRLQDRPVFRAQASVRFDGPDAFVRGSSAVRRLAQSGLHPTNCRLLDPGEAATSGASSAPGEAVLVLGFESADHPLDAWMARALELCRDAGGAAPEGSGATGRGDAAPRDAAAGAWRDAFLKAPYLRDTLVCLGVLSETFETAVTWDRFEAFHAGVMQAAQEAVTRVCGTGSVACRFTHAYPDGPAPYYTVLAPARRGGELAQWAEIKAAATEAILRLGGTITHHHSVGRDHRSGYDRERPDGFARALSAAKSALDPAWTLNPGVLIDRG